MKALLVITGRGLGGDAVIALNIIRSLEKKGIHCEIALDYDAPGLIFKKNSYNWHKISIPQAGGHAATKLATIKAGFKTIKASIEARKLIKKLKVDVVVGIIGGGAVVGCVGAKLAKIPAVGVINTPTDTKVCTRLNTCIAFPEIDLFRSKNIPKNVHKSFYPLTSGITDGDKTKALAKLKEISKKNIKNEKNLFDENKPSILFSSGSSLFELMTKAISNASNPELSDLSDKYNLLLVGIPLEEEYLDLIEESKIIYLGYIDWIKDLYELIDLAILTDDGVMIQEAMACELPTIALTRVKWGRYHNMAGIFSGAVIESNIDELNNKIEESIGNLDEMKNKAKEYSKQILLSNEKISKIIIDEAKNK